MTAPQIPIQLVQSLNLASRGAYAYAAVAHDVSRLVFTAGACPLDEDGVIVAVSDVAAQTARVMTNLRIALQAAEAKLTDVVKTTVMSPASAARTCKQPGVWSSDTLATTTHQARCWVVRSWVTNTSSLRSRRLLPSVEPSASRLRVGADFKPRLRCSRGRQRQ
jgi:enamine deaminase RidA (YjgF/YER057c/UK114 family)